MALGRRIIFRKLKIGQRFKADGHTWRKRRLEIKRPGDHAIVATNAEEIPGMQHRRYFETDSVVETTEEGSKHVAHDVPEVLTVPHRWP